MIKNIIFVAFCLLSIACVAFGSKKRAKRFAGYLDGGACILTGNKLFINHIYDHDLSSDEQAEFLEWQNASREYILEVIQYGNQLVAYENQELDYILSDYPQTTPKNPITMPPLPTSPDPPSFCSRNATAQYYFGGCIVQNNKVYVGTTYARDLTADEVDQLYTYVEQKQVYENYVEKQEEQRWKVLSKILNGKNSNSTSNSTTSENTTAPVLPPTPNFCLIIVNFAEPIESADYILFENEEYYDYLYDDDYLSSEYIDSEYGSGEDIEIGSGKR